MASGSILRGLIPLSIFEVCSQWGLKCVESHGGGGRIYRATGATCDATCSPLWRSKPVRDAEERDVRHPAFAGLR